MNPDFILYAPGPGLSSALYNSGRGPVPKSCVGTTITSGLTLYELGGGLSKFEVFGSALVFFPKLQAGV